jgi:hypothetical protein
MGFRAGEGAGRKRERERERGKVVVSHLQRGDVKLR